MNGVHDMGGMQGMGRINIEYDEPVFHATWEGRMYAINRAMGAWRKWNLDAWRFDIEQLPPADYLRMSYYEKWLASMERRLVNHGLLTATELATGQPETPRVTPALTLEAARHPGRVLPSAHDPSIPPLFQPGDHIRTKNIHPTGHTRLPRYARGKAGIIHRDHGVYDFPDTNAHFQGAQRQHVYAVRFAAQDLWGPQASPRDSVYIDLWDDYLEHA